MSLLVVCFDTGNTTVINEAIAALLAKDPNHKITYLIVGEAAQNIFKNRLHEPNVIQLTDWLPQATLSEFNDRPLTEAEKEIVLAKLNELNPDKAITTSSCFPQAKVPYQIAEMLTERLADENNFIYNGDFFQDLLKNPVWVSLPTKWAGHVSFLLAMAEEARRMQAINNSLTCYVVGSSAIDKMLVTQEDPEKRQEAQQKIQQTLQQLGVTADQQLLFISGSKELEEDTGLLHELYKGLRNQPATLAIRMGLHPGTQDMQSYAQGMLEWLDAHPDELYKGLRNQPATLAIRMGLHPGTQDMQSYAQGMLEWLDAHPEFSAKLIITKAVKDKLTDTTILQNDKLLEVNLGGDAVYAAATAVASAIPSTLATQAIIQGKKTFCASKNVGTSYLSTFFSANPSSLTAAAAEQKMLSKEVLGLPNAPAVALIADKLLEVHDNRLRR